MHANGLVIHRRDAVGIEQARGVEQFGRKLHPCCTATHNPNGELGVLTQLGVGIAQEGINHIPLEGFGLLGRVNKMAVLCDPLGTKIIRDTAK